MLQRLADIAQRRGKRIVIGAVVLAVVAGVFGAGVASRLAPYGADDPATDSVKTDKSIERATGLESEPGVVALVSDRSRSKVAGVARTLASDREVGRVLTWYQTHDPTMVSKDGRSTYVVAWLKKDADDSKAADRLIAAFKGQSGVKLGGDAMAQREANKTVQEDLARAELLALPLLFLLSLWFFRSGVAAILPPLMGGLSIVLTFLALRIASEFMSLSVFALNLVTGLGLGLAIDYSLFMISRYREETAKHGYGAEALRRTMASAGRTVLFSSLTVAAALASLLVFPQRFLYSMGVGGVVVALLSASVALVVLSSTLALLGPRVNALSPNWLRRAADADARPTESGAWYRISRFVMRRPAPIAVLSATFLIVLGLPFWNIKLTSVDATVLPTSTQARQVDTALKTRFPDNNASPVVVEVKAPPGEETAAVAGRIRQLPGVAAVGRPQQLGNQPLSLIDVVPRNTSTVSGSAQDVVRDIRALDAPAGVGVTGASAAFVDLKRSIADHLPYALGLLALTTVVVLFLFTGSVILPIKALVMNALSLSAAFGLLVLIFQDGRLESFLGYVSQGALETTQPVVLFAVAFGLSTDYGVFLLSRIKEARAQGVPDREAVPIGLERTGRIVTAAALLFCVAIGAFATSRIVFIKELGVGTALAVLIDATIVRALLVPSLMALLGKWNWWAPKPLRRLHERIGLDEAAAPA
ncbi:MAG TPA: MMPL family transporter [Thermoleophilaceae bacterium]|nr:MMPL family transporter [Thermoleophilaceae bacterium]